MELKFLTGKLEIEASGAISRLSAAASSFCPSLCNTWMFHNLREMAMMSRSEPRLAFTWCAMPTLSTPVTENKKQCLGLLWMQKNIWLTSPVIVPSPTVLNIYNLGAQPSSWDLFPEASSETYDCITVACPPDAANQKHRLKVNNRPTRILRSIR